MRPAGAIRRMVARTAYAQLGYRAAALVGMIAALALVFLAPPLLAVFADGPARWLGLAAWAAMALALPPTLRRFGLSRWRGLALPGIAAAYHGVHAGFGAGAMARPRRHVERRGRSARRIRGQSGRGLNRGPHYIRLITYGPDFASANEPTVFDLATSRRPMSRGQAEARDLSPCPPCRTLPRQRCSRTSRWPDPAAARPREPLRHRHRQRRRASAGPASRPDGHWVFELGGGCHHPVRIRHAAALLRPERPGAGGADRPLPPPHPGRAGRHLRRAAGRSSMAGRSISPAR